MRGDRWLVILLSICAGLAATPVSALSRADAKTAASGKTQVVAKAAGREITLSELRTEIINLRLSPNDPSSERIALDSIITRALLARAARKADLHRRPEAIARMRAAQDQALADLYLGVAAQPPEPTRGEIEDFIRENPSLFADRRLYDFLILTLPTSAFDEETLTPLFDEARNFEALGAVLEDGDVLYTISSATQPSTAFPKPVREQLARYTISDNIVLKGEAQTQIMKITRARSEAAPSSEWPALARRILIDEASSKRAGDVLKRLKGEASIAYYRQSAAPAESAPANK